MTGYGSDVIESRPSLDGSTGHRLGVILAAVAFIASAATGAAIAETVVHQYPASAHSEHAPVSRPAEPPDQLSAVPVSRSARSSKYPPAAPWSYTGHRYWAVTLALTADGNDPRIAEANWQAQAIGYRYEIARLPIDCESGAREGFARAGVRLRPDVEYLAVSLFFVTPQQAKAFVDAYQPGVVGTVPVTMTCSIWD